MVKKPVPMWTIAFLLFAACEAPCQKRSSVDCPQPPQGKVSNTAETRCQQMSVWKSLPDAPSPVQAPTQAERFEVFVHEADSPLALGEMELGYSAGGLQPRLTASDHAAGTGKAFGGFWGRYLYGMPRNPSLYQAPLYGGPTSDSFMGRAMYAASRILVTHDDSGTGRLNTAYFLGVLTSAALHASSRPYGARSAAATFNNFGSTIGGDAGANVFHAFEPDLGHMVRRFAPKFVSRIERRIAARPITPP
jgi:hypothetical protein